MRTDSEGAGLLGFSIGSARFEASHQGASIDLGNPRLFAPPVVREEPHGDRAALPSSSNRGANLGGMRRANILGILRIAVDFRLGLNKRGSRKRRINADRRLLCEIALAILLQFHRKGIRNALQNDPEVS